MPRNIRRVVTGHDAAGRSVIIVDETMTRDMGHVLTPPGQDNVRLSDVWIAKSVPAPLAGNADTVEGKVTLEPPRGGAVFRTVELPPDSERNYDSMRKYFEQMGAHGRLGGGKHPAMHKTATLDFLVVIEGEVWMILDEGEVHLKAGDCIVQRATMHAWSNRSDKPCILAGILIDGQGA